jgi:hypothetical protein
MLNSLAYILFLVSLPTATGVGTTWEVSRQSTAWEGIWPTREKCEATGKALNDIEALLRGTASTAPAERGVSFFCIEAQQSSIPEEFQTYRKRRCKLDMEDIKRGEGKPDWDSPSGRLIAEWTRIQCR